MTDLLELSGAIDDATFFAPASTDMVDSLVAQYRAARTKIDRVAEFMASEIGSVLNYFLEGNKDSRDRWHGMTGMFEPKGAIAALNSDYWQRALKLTDVIDCMPQKRRDEWFEHIRKHTTPDFEEETVRDTIGSLLAMRSTFFAERVDGMFRALSGDHVTNRPEGFGKRMIVGHVITCYGTVDGGRCGYINDLRCVIAKFMGRDEPGYGDSDALVRAARRNNGVWMDVDGGALRLRIYNGVGTAHLEVHPDMAWRLNCVLASLYPTAIPPKFRQRPKRSPKGFELIQRPLPFAVVGLLAGMEQAREKTDDFRNPWRQIPMSLAFRYHNLPSKVAKDEAERVLEAIGGAKVKVGNYEYFQFDYDFREVLDRIVCSGCVPCDKSHQFYPTPESLATKSVDLAEIEDQHLCLEPSAGTGALADLMPKGRTTCVEVSQLRASVLTSKGHDPVICDDFVAWADETRARFDRVVMNPPFSEGRWLAHLVAAEGLLVSDGRLVAILPASAKGKDLMPRCQLEWHGPFDNEFAGTSVSVVILVATRSGRRMQV